MIKPVLISLEPPYFNQNFFFFTSSRTKPTNSLFTLMLIFSLLLYYFYFMFNIINNPIVIFIFLRFTFFLSLISVSEGELLFLLKVEVISDIGIYYKLIVSYVDILILCHMLLKTESIKKA